LSPESDIKTSEPAVPTAWENGCYKPTNFKGGVAVLGRMNQNMRHCFAAVIRQSARPISSERQSSKKY